MNNYTPEQLNHIFLKVKEFVTDPNYKLRIIDLRKFIDEIYPRESDSIKNDLAEIKEHFGNLNNRVAHIETCLGIDFKLDSLKTINYDFIKDDLIRDKINAYYREMLRYQFGTRNHKICFAEFCRLAIIQIEIMLNYFYTDNNHPEIVKTIAGNKYQAAKKKWEEDKKKDPKKEPNEKDFENYVQNNKEELVPSYSLALKSNLFIDTYLKYRYINNFSIKSISIWISDIRNRKSHGSKDTIEPFETDFLSEEEKQRLEKSRKKLEDKVSQFNQERKDKIAFEKNRLNPHKVGWDNVTKEIKDIYNKQFSPLQFAHEESFDCVHDFLRIIASTCAKNLKKPLLE